MKRVGDGGALTLPAESGRGCYWPLAGYAGIAVSARLVFNAPAAAGFNG